MPKIFGLEFNPFKLLKKVDVPAPNVPASAVTDKSKLAPEQMRLLLTAGFESSRLAELIARETLVNFERMALYREIDRAMLYPLIGAAMELYADVCTDYNKIHNATVWVTGDKMYVSELEKLFNRVGLEEKIFDWCHTTGTYGDFIMRLQAQPGMGVIAVEDYEHPVNYSRIDFNGRLVGFYDSPLGGVMTSTKLMPPWEFIHFRLLACKRKRPIYNDPTYTEFRTVSMIDPETRKITGKYGMSLLQNALPIYKRLRLSEDSVLMARLSKGPLRYLFKLKVDGSNFGAIQAILEQYQTLLKRQKAQDLGVGGVTGAMGNYEDQYGALPVGEDIFLPVFGDARNDLTIDKMGGEPDIRWITDIGELRSQLSCALRVPLQMLGGFTEELPSTLGQSSLERLDIRFARSARRLQRSMIEGITRMCQIHLAYVGMNPDMRLFQIQMSDTSTAEEEELKNALDKGVDVVDKLYDMLTKFTGEEIDKMALLNYLNQKILKLGDLDMRKFLKAKPGAPTTLTPESIVELAETAREEKLWSEQPQIFNSDLKAMLPISSQTGLWERRYGKMRFKVCNEHGAEMGVLSAKESKDARTGSTSDSGRSASGPDRPDVGAVNPAALIPPEAIAGAIGDASIPPHP